MKQHRIYAILVTLFASLLLVAPVQAYTQPAVNLGFTSFLDGGPPAGPGFYFTQYMQYLASAEFYDENGEKGIPPLRNSELDVWVGMTQFIYQSDTDTFLGGKWGVDLIIPYVGFDLDRNTLISASDSGIGDILFGPFMQWGPIMGQNGPVFMHRIELQMIFPTGEYDKYRTLNPGSNHFSFNPYWAATLFITPRWTLSWRVHYLWNAENDDTTAELYPGYDDMQAGQAVHLNYAMAFEVVPKWFRVGVNGYWYLQTTESTLNGVDFPDDPLWGPASSKEQVFAIGPGAVIHFGQDFHLFFNAYFESAVENRPEGNRFTLRFVGHF